MKEKIELGDRVKDKISGLKGIVIGITDWLYGCRRIHIQPEAAKDNKPVEGFGIDEPQAEIIKKRVIVPPSTIVIPDERRAPPPVRRSGPGGPHVDPVRPKDPTR